MAAGWRAGRELTHTYAAGQGAFPPERRRCVRITSAQFRLQIESPRHPRPGRPPPPPASRPTPRPCSGSPPSLAPPASPSEWRGWAPGASTSPTSPVKAGSPSVATRSGPSPGLSRPEPDQLVQRSRDASPEGGEVGRRAPPPEGRAERSQILTVEPQQLPQGAQVTPARPCPPALPARHRGGRRPEPLRQVRLRPAALETPSAKRVAGLPHRASPPREHPVLVRARQKEEVVALDHRGGRVEHHADVIDEPPPQAPLDDRRRPGRQEDPRARRR